MTPQGQVLTLKSPLVPGQVAAVPSTLLQAELKPRAANTTVTAQPGMIIENMLMKIPGYSLMFTVYKVTCSLVFLLIFHSLKPSEVEPH